MEGSDLYKPNNFEKKADPILLELWAKYDFPHKPPFKESIAESRLQEACRNYKDIVDNLGSSSFYRGDSENYIPQSRILKRASSSDARRREIHNQIALMVMGKQRSGMDSEVAEHIANFALEYAESL